MTHDAREQLTRTHDALLRLQAELSQANLANHRVRMWRNWTIAGMMTCLLIMGLYWPGQRECATVEAMSQERLGDMEAMRAGVVWYQAEVTREHERASRWELQSIKDLAALKVAQQELGVLLARDVVIPEPKPLDRLDVAMLPIKAMLGRWMMVRP